MIARFILVLVLLEMALSQKQPPPPPGAKPACRGRSCLAIQPAEAEAPACRGRKCLALPPPPFKWVYCGGSWRQVTPTTCPVAFSDPDFSDHQCVCSPSGSLYQTYPGGSMWLWLSPGFSFCAHMPRCFCPACN
eukprot:GFUD01007863.1.p1 GENE.GFUD01007863.1~~GFUD01007863.1.p1  ORF type:complete len:134 (+),score=25.71 GFUD01007863.1:39-440(+)